jgi:acyl carrier protein
MTGIMSEILQSIYETVEEVNRQLPDEQQLQKSPNTIIVGHGGVLDSLGVINFLVALEDTFSRETGSAITLLDEEIISEPDGLLKTIGHIEQFIASKL